MLSYIPVILVVGIHVGIRVPSSSVRVASAPVCAVCVAVGPGSLSGLEFALSSVYRNYGLRELG